MKLGVTSVVIAYIKSDQVKQSVDNLEKYRLFTQDKFKCSFAKNSTSVVPYSERSCWKETFTHTIPINSRGKKQLRSVFQKFFTSVVQI